MTPESNEEKIDKQFWDFHAKNPIVYDLFYEYASTAKSVGFKTYGASAIIERIRWHINVELRRQWTEEDEEPQIFKINNNYKSRYARLLIALNPEFKGFFRNRRLKTYSVLAELDEEE